MPATVKADGRPQLSPVQPFSDASANVLHVSTGAGTAKAANLRRDARATPEVTSADGMSWATAEGIAAITGPGTDPHGPEVEALSVPPVPPHASLDQIEAAATAILKGDSDRGSVVKQGLKAKVQEMLPGSRHHDDRPGQA